jgi:uncharacterized membrane protein YccF (DUF307 family)
VSLVYTLVIGIPLCAMLVTAGLILCVTIIGLPVGLALIGLGFKYLTLPQRRFL